LGLPRWKTRLAPAGSGGKKHDLKKNKPVLHVPAYSFLKFTFE
jgi:hypothetical protein